MSGVPRPVALILEVADLDRSAALYRDAFGLNLHPADHGGGDRWTSGRHAAVSWTDGAFFHFALYQAKGNPTAGAQLGLSVPDLAAAHQQALAAGAALIHGPRPEPWGASARYRDYDGNVIELTQRSD